MVTQCRQQREGRPDEVRAGVAEVDPCGWAIEQEEPEQRTGESEQLVPIVSDMASMQPQNAMLRSYLIDLLVRVGRQPQAIAELDALGEIQLNAGHTREAIDTIERIIALEPSNREDYSALLVQLQHSL